MSAKEDGPTPGADLPLELPDVDGELDRALALVRLLRRHCSWDAAQTPRTLLPHLLEESREVVDAVRSDDPYRIEGELGDLLLNVAFQVVLGEEEGRFDAASVAARLEEKMKARHPHLFGGGEAEGWERIKARERVEGGVLEGLAEGLDPLHRAHRIQDRAAGVGFDWAEAEGAREKVEEELREVGEAMALGRGRRLEEELGDLIFAVVNLVRLAGSHPATALDAANRKFTARFERLEALAEERGVELGSASLEELDALWEEVKREEGARRETESPEGDGRADAGADPA